MTTVGPEPLQPELLFLTVCPEDLVLYLNTLVRHHFAPDKISTLPTFLYMN